MGKGIIILLVVVLVAGFMLYPRIMKDKSPITNNSIQNNTNTTIVQQGADDFKIASWNLQIFGDTKASKPEVMSFYKSTIDNYDIIFIQEIRDEDGSAFIALCYLLQDYTCRVSSRAGRSTSKEQYGVIYRNNISLLELYDYNPDSQDRWERPPIRATFDLGEKNITFYTIHTRPDSAVSEIDALERIINNDGYVAVLGDLNADCDYYQPDLKRDFVSWNWLIKDTEDTTVSGTDCAYDRIISNQNLSTFIKSSGVYKEGINESISDHYLIYFKINI